jgi:uncharacterized protein (TIGR02996 family)
MPTTSPELSALLNACRAAPADDTPRLVLADWLDEHGDGDRAEFVRLQCELARPTLDVERTAALRASERELIRANWPRWAGELPQVMADIWREVYAAARERYWPGAEGGPAVRTDPMAGRQSWGFRRGLLWVELTPLVARDDRFLGWCRGPEAEWLEEAGLELPGAAALAEWEVPDPVRPYLGLSVKIALSSDESAGGRDHIAGLRRALGCPNFRLVRGLAVTLADDDPRSVGQLLAADVRCVTRLSVAGPGVTDAAVAAIAAAPFEGLSALDVSTNNLGPAAARALAGSRSLRRLAVLAAWRNRFGDDGLMALFESPLAASLTRVELMNTGLGDRATVALASSPLLARLYGPGLNLTMNKIGDAGAKALAGCEYLARFRELVLRENEIGNAGVRALAGSPYAANLTYLDLWKNRVGSRGARALAASDHLGRVHDLCLRDNRIGRRGEAALRQRYGDRAKV